MDGRFRAHRFPSESPYVPIQGPSKTRLDGHSGGRADVKHPEQVRRVLGPPKADKSWKTAF